ncbi:class II glutamine amidotransferase [Actinacidiphila sp. bgisy167]|uniref:class II glutamine amidotransferase n=1 Tax=Actinacidiphila sp. bgisy167 TaxID=3413797 RepID=UPI003D71CCCE
MCRFLGVVADRPAPVSELLTGDLEPFLAMACEHEHGWGVAYRDSHGAIRITKEPERGDRSAKLRSLLDTCVTDMAVVHLRMASPGLPVHQGNTHPFGDARAAFLHNGDFNPRKILDTSIDPDLLRTAEGDTDSERYYLAVRTLLDRGTPPAKAVARTAEEIRMLADAYVSLNCLLLTPSGLFAYNEHSPDSEVIQRRGATYFDLYHRTEGGRLVIGSEGALRPDAVSRQAPVGCVMEISAENRDVVVHDV